MLNQTDPIRGAPAAPAVILGSMQATRLRLRSSISGFTLAELLVTTGVLVLMVLLATQLLNSAATITTLGHKQMDADSQARELFDRMAIDVMQMVKRSDVYYHLKASTSATDCPSTECGTQPGNDEIAFYSNVPGYYASGTDGKQSSMSIVGYRINVSATTLANRMERLGAGLVWNGVSTTTLPNTPIVFWTALNPWDSTIATTNTLDIVGSHVFRFEYYYLLKGQTDPTTGIPYPSIPSATPWDTRVTGRTSVSGMRDVAAIVADVAAIDARSRVLLTNGQITTLAGSLADYSGQAPGVLLSSWRNAIDANTSLPRPAISGIRLYERYIYLSPPTL
jgi:hypothetical protein